MKTNHIYLPALMISWAIIVSPCVTGYSDDQPARPTREQLRDQLKNLSPEEREAKLKELREKYSKGNPDRALLEKKRDELKGLSPEEREAKIREWRLRGNTNLPALRRPTPEEIQAKRKELKARLVQQIDALRNQKSLTADEQKRLERMQDLAKRLEVPLTASTNAPAWRDAPKPPAEAPVTK